MAIYKNPVLGKYGIRSGVSKNLVFGICCDTALECWEQLDKHMGYWDTQKYRWFISQWYEDDIKEQEEFIEEKKEERRKRKEEKRERERLRKEHIQLILDNMNKLDNEQLAKFNNKHQSKVDNIPDLDYRDVAYMWSHLKSLLKISEPKKEVEKIEEVKKEETNNKPKYNTNDQHYKGILLNLIARTDYMFKMAKRFSLNRTNQNVWIPNIYLEEDGTIRKNVDIDFVFRKAQVQLSLAGYTGAIIGIKRADYNKSYIQSVINQ